jgi:membrane protein YdbS with pleckstrin-like domain
MTPGPTTIQGDESMAATNTSPSDAGSPVMTVNTADLAPATPAPPSQQAQDPQTPFQEPADDPANKKEAQQEDQGVGVEGEATIWEARYSQRNFLGRIALRVVLTIGAIALAYYTWGAGHENFRVLTWLAIGVVALLWVGLIVRMVQAHYSHYYRLTNRRLFVSTGVIHRRRDMLELLTVKDVFTRQQSLMERWMGLGTVVVVPNAKDLPTFYLAGVDSPKEVMDMVWHYARVEREGRAIEMNSI